MKKIALLALAFSLLLSSCSLSDIQAMVQNSAPGPSGTPTDTIAPEQGEPVVETTLTITATPSDRPTFTPLPVVPETTPVPTITLPAQTNLFLPTNSIFVSMGINGSQIVWGFCDGPRSVEFNVRVTNPLKVRRVLLFLRLQDKFSARRTEWGGGAIMLDDDHGNYYYTLKTDAIYRYEEFYDAWVQYQIVATDRNLKVLSRSQVYQDQISLSHCSFWLP